MLNCFTKSLPNCCAKWIFGIILRQIAAPNQYLRSICAKNVRQILFESLFCAEDLSEIHPQIHPGFESFHIGLVRDMFTPRQSTVNEATRGIRRSLPMMLCGLLSNLLWVYVHIIRFK
jgi:hypothetical protein